VRPSRTICGTPGRRPRRAYTLLELVVALALTAVLMLGMASAVLVASRAVDPQTPDRLRGAAAEAAVRLAQELAFATAFTERTDHSLAFTVADRTGDDVEETIRWAWSGTEGDPLTRTYNGGAAAVVLEDVREFGLDYLVESTTEDPPPTENESAEMLLASRTAATDPRDYALTKNDWLAQRIAPSLPAEAVAWRVTRVLVKARLHGGTAGVTAVQLRLPDSSGLPSTTVLAEVPMYESRLAGAYLWQEFRFDTGGLRPGQAICLALVCRGPDPHLADVRYDNAATGGMCLTDDGEDDWWDRFNDTLLYALFGTVTTRTDPDPVTRRMLRRVRIRLRTGPDQATAVETSARLLGDVEISE